MERTFTTLEAPQGEPDDLARITGIGAAMARGLNAAGIFHFWQIGLMSSQDVEAIEKIVQVSGKRNWPAWIEQARKLVETSAAESPPAVESPPSQEPPSRQPADAVEEFDIAVSTVGALTAEAHEHGHLIVKTRAMASRRRAGRGFGPTEVSIPLAELTPADLAAIDADPELVAFVRL
jgi:hypothetical protein